MSDVETAPTGAEVAPVVQETTPEVAQNPTTEQTQTEQIDPPRDEKGRFVPQERVNEITRARREAERGWESERRLRESLEQQLAQVKGPQSQPAGDAPPSLEEFGYDSVKWGVALAEYATRHATTQAEARIREQEQQRRAQESGVQYEERARAFATEHPDYDARFNELSGVVRFAPEVLEVLAASEKGPAIVYHLANHLDEADALSRMPAHIAAVQLGRLEAQLSVPKPKPVTQAPAPVPTVGSGTVASKNPDDMSVAEWMEWRNSKL